MKLVKEKQTLTSGFSFHESSNSKEETNSTSSLYLSHTAVASTAMRTVNEERKEKKFPVFPKNNEGDSPGSLGSIFSKNGDTSWAAASTKLIFQCSAGFLKAKPRAFRVTDAGFRARDLNSSTASKMEEETFESLVGNLMLSSTIKPGCEQTLCFLSK